MFKKYTIVLSKDQYEFLKKLAKHDSISVRMEVQSLLDLQIRETQEVMQEFWEGETDGESK